jgi:hypothetical protein
MLSFIFDLFCNFASFFLVFLVFLVPRLSLYLYHIKKGEWSVKHIYLSIRTIQMVLRVVKWSGFDLPRYDSRFLYAVTDYYL